MTGQVLSINGGFAMVWRDATPKKPSDKDESTHMDFDLSTEQKLIQDSARSMMERDVQPILDKHDLNKSLPKASMLRFSAISRIWA